MNHLEIYKKQTNKDILSLREKLEKKYVNGEKREIRGEVPND